MKWTRWDKRWELAYQSGPVRVLVCDGRRLRRPRLLPFTIHAVEDALPMWMNRPKPEKEEQHDTAQT